MDDTTDLTLMSGTITEIARDVRLLRLPMDAMASRLTAHDGRFGALDGRVGALEQSFHELTNEVSRGFGQMQQQLTRQEKRFDALDAALAALPERLTAHIEQIVLAIGAGRTP